MRRRHAGSDADSVAGRFYPDSSWLPLGLGGDGFRAIVHGSSVAEQPDAKQIRRQRRDFDRRAATFESHRVAPVDHLNVAQRLEGGRGRGRGHELREVGARVA